MDGGLAAGIVGTRVWGIMSTGAFWGGTLLGSKPYLYDGVFLTGGYPTNNTCLGHVCVDTLRIPSATVAEVFCLGHGG